MKRTARFVKGEMVWEPPFTEEEKAQHAQNMRDMLDSGRSPFLNTNTSFLSSFGDNGRQFAHIPQVGDLYKEIASDAGVDVKGKVYLAGLADSPGDPRAWVSDRDEALRVAESRGWGAEGAGCKVAPRLDGEPKRVGLADDIINEKVSDILESHPEPQKVNVQELKQQVYDKHKPSWAE